jgi:hypothetical protein
MVLKLLKNNHERPAAEGKTSENWRHKVMGLKSIARSEKDKLRDNSNTNRFSERRNPIARKDRNRSGNGKVNRKKDRVQLLSRAKPTKKSGKLINERRNSIARKKEAGQREEKLIGVMQHRIKER